MGANNWAEHEFSPTSPLDDLAFRGSLDIAVRQGMNAEVDADMVRAAALASGVAAEFARRAITP